MSNNLPGLYNFPAHYRRDFWAGLDLRIIDSATEEAVDLTGATVKLTFISASGKRIEFNSTTEGEFGVYMGDDTGVIKIGPINSFNISVGPHRYDLEVTDPSGMVRTYLSGEILVLEDITK